MQEMNPLHHHVEMLRQAAARSLLSYLEFVSIDGSQGRRVFGEVAEPWQRRSLWPIMRACEQVCGMRSDYSGPRCFWRDLPAGHDKTSGIARILNGLVAFSPKNIAVGCFARDTDQAKRIWKFMKDEARLNPWLEGLLVFTSSPSHRVRNEATGTEVTIYDADFEGNAGHKLHVCVCEEITWWPEKGKQLYDQLFSRRIKIQDSVFVVLGNAGVKRTWQHREMLEASRDARDWDYYRTDGVVAGWMDRAQVERDARKLGPALADRVIHNRWIDQDEMRYLPRAELTACEDLAESLKLRRHYSRQKGYVYFASIDGAVTRDYATLALVGVPDVTLEGLEGLAQGVRVVADMEVLKASDFGGRIPMKEIESLAVSINDRFRPAWIVDPYQLEWFCQNYEGVWDLERAQFRSGAFNQAMAEQVKKFVLDRLLLWPPNLGLIYKPSAETDALEAYTLADEFADLVVKDMPSYGYRWDHKRHLNDDRAMAVGMALWLSLRRLPYHPTGAAAPKIWVAGEDQGAAASKVWGDPAPGKPAPRPGGRLWS